MNIIIDMMMYIHVVTYCRCVCVCIYVYIINIHRKKHYANKLFAILYAINNFIKIHLYIRVFPDMWVKEQADEALQEQCQWC